MAEKPVIFCDGFENLHILRGTVRLDLFVLDHKESDEKGDPKHRTAGQLVLSPESFLQTYAVMDQAIAQMEKHGLIKRRDDQETS
ncbi:hypothetical protein ACQZV8_18950 [Magnetococcales bacterium HHB-1]